MRTTVLALSAAMALAALACSDEETTATTSNPAGSGGEGMGQGGMPGGGNGGNPSAGGMGGMGGGTGNTGPYVVCDNPPASYPAPPYGTDVGDTIAAVAMQGWTTDTASQRVDMEPFGSFSTDDIRQDGSPFVLVHLALTF